MMRVNLQPFIETNVTFGTNGVELVQNDVVTNMASDQDGDLAFTMLPNKSRGIFVKVCQKDASELQKVKIHALKYSRSGNVLIEIERLFIDYDAYTQEIAYKDIGIRNTSTYRPKPDVTDPETCEVVSIRGVQEVEVIVDEKILSPFTVQFSAETWQFSLETQLYFQGMALTIVCMMMSVCFKNGWCFCSFWKCCQCCVDQQDSLREKLRASDISNFDFGIKVATCVVFNFDLVTDFLYNFRVPFYNTWIKMISRLSLFLPILIMVVPWLVSVGYGLIEMAVITFYRQEYYQGEKDEIYQQYIRKATIIFGMVAFNGIQFLTKNLEKRIEGDTQYQRLKIIARDTEIDEKLLELDTFKETKTLNKNVIKQFRNYYPDDLNIINEFQLDYTVFINAWEMLSDRSKGIRIKCDDKNLVKFFKQMSEDKQFEQKISDSEKNLKLREIQDQNLEGKEQLQNIYEFDGSNKVLVQGQHGKIYKSTLKSLKGFDVVIQAIKKKDHLSEIDNIKEAFNKIKVYGEQPNIARYYQFYEDDDTLYLVMEYFGEYTTIRDKILLQKSAAGEDDDDDKDDKQEDESTEREQQAFYLIKQLLQAINTMHFQSHVHNELRPDNILIMGEDVLKLIDANLFRVQKDSDDDLYYRPPEYFRRLKKYDVHFDHSRAQGKESDIWAIGVLLYNLLSGKQPFQGDGDNEDDDIIKSIQKDEIHFDYDIFEDISSDAKDLVKKMLVKNPKKRITAEQALNHVWLRQDDVEFNKQEKELHINIMKRLKKFRRRSMLKHMTLMKLVEQIEDGNKRGDTDFKELHEQCEQLKRVYTRMDKNNSFQISKEELFNYYKDLGIKISSQKAEMILIEVDYKESGHITTQEFVCATLEVSKLVETEKGQKLLQRLFKMFQCDESIERKGDFLTRQDISQAWKNFGEEGIDLSEPEMLKIFEQHDLFKDNSVKWEEFHTIFQNTASLNIGKQIKQFMEEMKKEITENGTIEPAQYVVDQKLAQKINEQIDFKKDDGFIYYSEFVYKIFKYKYDKLETNIFQIKTESLFVQENQFDDVIEKMAEERVVNNLQLSIKSRKNSTYKSLTEVNQSQVELNTFPTIPIKESGTKVVPQKIARSITKSKVTTLKDNMMKSVAKILPSSFVSAMGEQEVDQKTVILNKLYALDVEVQFAQKQDTYMYLSNLKGIKLTKHEVENKFLDHDLKESVNQAWLKVREQQSQISQKQTPKPLTLEAQFSSQSPTKLNPKIKLPPIKGAVPAQNSPRFNKITSPLEIQKNKTDQEGYETKLPQSPYGRKNVLNQKVLNFNSQTAFSLTSDNSEVSFEQFKFLTILQNERYSRMIEFEFKYPDEQMNRKYEYLKELAKLDGSQKVTIKTIKEYHAEKVKPFTLEPEPEQKDQDEDGQDDEDALIQREPPKIDITQVKDIFERIMDSRLKHYKDQIQDIKQKNAAKMLKRIVKLPEQNILMQKSEKNTQQKTKYDPVMKLFNKQLLKQKLKGAIFKRVGIQQGDFTIHFGDKSDLTGSEPYIDNGAIRLFNKYDDLEDPYMYPDQQMIIAQYKESQKKESKIMILQFDKYFKKIIDGAICVENQDIEDAMYEYTHSFNNWVDKNKKSANYYRQKFSFLTEGLGHDNVIKFIKTKLDQEMDDEDKEKEQQIIDEITTRTDLEWYENEKEFRQQVSIAKSVVGIGFGVLEDIPQLVIQQLNSIMIGQTLSFIQLSSPLTSTVSALVRIYSIGSWDLFPESKDMSDNTNKKCLTLFAMTMFNLFIMGFCVLPVLLTVFNNYYTDDPVQIDWIAKNFKTVRWCEVSSCTFLRRDEAQ